MKNRRGLSPKAFETLKEGEVYEPYVSDAESPLEFTVKAAVAGILFGILFGAANAYLGLRAGLTISTSIPVAVMTVAAFKAMQAVGRKASILEANQSQTIGSASSSVASGVIFTLPALFLWGLDPTLVQMTLLAMFGGCLGILFMIPLRRFLIQKEHGHLPYPEGTACAEVLVASDTGGGHARNVFLGLGLGAFFKFITGWIRIIPDDIHVNIPFLKKGQVGLDVSAALFGVGYILGPRIATVMVGGGLLSWLVIIPAIAYWGEGRTIPLYPETVKLIPDMTPGEIWTRYIRYIGAGAVATGGLVTLIKNIPTMIESFKMGAQQFRARLDQSGIRLPRTGQDLPLSVVGIGSALIALAMAVVPHVFGNLDTFAIRLAGAVLVVIFAFFFVTVSSRIVGLVGVTSNPTSGMTIASLLGTSSVFLLFGWTDDVGKVAALTIGCVIAIAASIAGDTSQDLKTGFLLGATPRKQQIGELAGVLTSATFVCLAVLLLDSTYGFGTQELPAPQATLMKVVIEGVLENALPWILVGIGVVIALACELVRIPSLPFAVGVYLPLSTFTPVFIGGMLRMLLEKKATTPDEVTSRREKGVLLGSGLVGGEGILGIGIAAVAFIQGTAPAGIGFGWAGPFAPFVALLAFALLALVLVRSCLR
ncbi:oligopeptide transporter, OPT family [candidate division KSB1 bacterium]|nr:oligopeptide transporter, OPT family [candidate division KSB1 bacterium]NIR70982.1 oligopeptide transporter, OPT family [candidate division KSB1 bacterium]NIS24723.1 oligopeptide transporter, OPT family [candidate division KSB1 bacterium]NIT71627.1 oligopeptide transporter, OPT family [candidate division KSB1 bacterium]NIU25334.1 oligopeptide transporter, OPT family [candidate division KSB1 bacterium]